MSPTWCLAGRDPPRLYQVTVACAGLAMTQLRSRVCPSATVEEEDSMRRGIVPPRAGDWDGTVREQIRHHHVSHRGTPGAWEATRCGTWAAPCSHLLGTLWGFSPFPPHQAPAASPDGSSTPLQMCTQGRPQTQHWAWARTLVTAGPGWAHPWVAAPGSISCPWRMSPSLSGPYSR